jgi:hypothetical protein
LCFNDGLFKLNGNGKMILPRLSLSDVSTLGPCTIATITTIAVLARTAQAPAERHLGPSGDSGICDSLLVPLPHFFDTGRRIPDNSISDDLWEVCNQGRARGGLAIATPLREASTQRGRTFDERKLPVGCVLNHIAGGPAMD